KHINRDISYYSLASYTFLNKYYVSTSFRWDGSNLFGVKTNQKGVPLWSLGGKWDVSKENFFPKNSVLNYFSTRITYGVAGNINKTVSHYPLIRYYNTSNPSLTNLADVTHYGNPSLKWER